MMRFGWNGRAGVGADAHRVWQLLAGSALCFTVACGSSEASMGVGGGAGSGTPPGSPPSSGGDPRNTPPPDTPTELSQILWCYYQDRAQQASCADDFMLSYTEADTTLTTQSLLAEMEATRPTDENFEALCHPVAHAIGRWTLEQTGSVPDAFEVCDASCHNGCYHGVMERVFIPEDSASDHATLEQIRARAPEVCADSEFENPSKTLLFQCFHGLGHGIMFSINYDLEAAIDTCGMVIGSIHQAECRGGVFMENIYAVDPALREIDPSDPHFPCDKFEGNIQGECYQMQTSLWVEYGMDDAEIAETCTEAGDGTEMHNSVLQCMTSLGRDLSDRVRNHDSERVRHACEDLLDSDTHSWYCIRGTVAALIDNTSDGRYALPFCNEFKSDDLKTDCYDIAQSHLRYALGYTHDQWVEQCASHALDRAACEAAFPAPTTP